MPKINGQEIAIRIAFDLNDLAAKVEEHVVLDTPNPHHSLLIAEALAGSLQDLDLDEVLEGLIENVDMEAVAERAGFYENDDGLLERIGY